MKADEDLAEPEDILTVHRGLDVLRFLRDARERKARGRAAYAEWIGNVVEVENV